MPTLNPFMIRVDEENFSALLRAEIPSVRFIDNYVWDTPNPPIYDSITECYGRGNSGAVIINEAIVTVDEYVRRWVQPHLSGRGT